jgi:t-SNARE complex subunit (syntaxin)
MLESDCFSTTSEHEETPNVDKMIVLARNKDVKQIEDDVNNMSLAQKMLQKIIQEQRENLDSVAEKIDNNVDITTAANAALDAAEKKNNKRRNRIIALSVAGAAGAVLTGVVVAVKFNVHDKITDNKKT